MNAPIAGSGGASTANDLKPRSPAAATGSTGSRDDQTPISKSDYLRRRSTTEAVHSNRRDHRPPQILPEFGTPSPTIAVMQHFIDVPGGRIYAESEGSGPAIVLVHAAIANLRAWDAMVPGLVAAGYRAVRYDCRGFGATTTEAVAFSNRADLIAVLDALGIGRAAVVGNSIGGWIAIDTAIEFPDRVAAVVGVGAGLGGFMVDATPEEDALFAQMDGLESGGDNTLDALADLLVRVWVDGPGQPADRVDPAVRESVRAMARSASNKSRVHGRPIPLKPSANDRLGELVCPVLAVAGQLDVSDVAPTARRLADAAPNARAVVMPGVAHMIGMEAPDEAERPDHRIPGAAAALVAAVYRGPPSLPCRDLVR